ncbi:MAG: BON domain-containing protein [Methylococcaceae bacterium]|nr:BON domain-containing protein [Methylococcaceae bacterium]
MRSTIKPAFKAGLMCGIVQTTPDLTARMIACFQCIALDSNSEIFSQTFYSLKEKTMNTTNECKQTLSAHKILVIACLSAVLGLAGCEKEGTAEKAGQKLDRAAENAEQRIEQAADRAEQKIDAAKESLDQKAGRAGDYIEGKTDASKEALEKAEQNIDQATEKAEKQLESAEESVSEKAQSAGEYIDDSMVTMKVKTELLKDPFLKSSQIEVTTVNGVVKLSGTVDSEASIGRAIEVAKIQQNVKSVQTDLVVNANAPDTK